ncbi:gamma-glutamylcyclotransferase [Eubacteriales bacterium OttesenSCG-928-A19]|nr:gamma-glutamylcyclotransferase [Eubacteriales bacterium OttesenSCG-928-A19]
MIYIAYGSNMNTDQMAHRCPEAKLLGTGRLLGYRLSFYVHATVERSRAKGAYVPVAVWEITQADEERLDRYEGFPNYYTKEDRLIQMDDGTTLDGMVYIMKLKRGGLPTGQYYHGILSAYRELGLHVEVEKVLYPSVRRAIAQEGRVASQ